MFATTIQRNDPPRPRRVRSLAAGTDNVTGGAAVEPERSTGPKGCGGGRYSGSPDWPIVEVFQSKVGRLGCGRSALMRVAGKL